MTFCFVLVQISKDLFVFSETVKDYVALLGSIKVCSDAALRPCFFFFVAVNDQVNMLCVEIELK